ncbi:hypothetical protein HDV00_003251 [Rhizophlyctis rosea]|nr:hypothetical protein HDV00_003251 [Rhizophlyctis rosea]
MLPIPVPTAPMPIASSSNGIQPIRRFNTGNGSRAEKDKQPHATPIFIPTATGQTPLNKTPKPSQDSDLKRRKPPADTGGDRPNGSSSSQPNAAKRRKSETAKGKKPERDLSFTPATSTESETDAEEADMKQLVHKLKRRQIKLLAHLQKAQYHFTGICRLVRSLEKLVDDTAGGSQPSTSPAPKQKQNRIKAEASADPGGSQARRPIETFFITSSDEEDGDSDEEEEEDESGEEEEEADMMVLDDDEEDEDDDDEEEEEVETGVVAPIRTKPAAAKPAAKSAAKPPIQPKPTAQLPTQPKAQPAPKVQVQPKPKVQIPSHSTWRTKSLEVLDIISDVRPTKIGEIKRKFRVLVLPEIPAFGDVAMTSSLDGCIQWWNLKKRPGSLDPIAAHRLSVVKWAETGLWAHDNMMVLGLSNRTDKEPKEPADNGSQVQLLTDMCLEKNGEPTFKIVEMASKPHDRTISALARMPYERNSVRFVTGGMDKKLLLWSTKGTETSHISSVHSLHTAAVNAAYWDNHKNVLWSGGADSKLVQWDLKKSTKVWLEKLNAPLRDILPIPTHPQTLLLSQTSGSERLHLWDTRTNTTTLTFGWRGLTGESAPPTTMYMHPHVHPCGYLISMGYNSNRHGRVSIWDVRYYRCEEGPTQSSLETLHDNRIIVAKFWQDRIVTLGNDNALHSSTYNISKNERPKALIL